MSLDQELRGTLTRESEGIAVPELDLPDLLARGELAVRRRSAARRRTLLVVAAVIVMVLGAGAALTLAPLGDPGPAGPPAPAPEPGLHLKDLPRGEQPSIPYCRGRDTIRGAGSPIPSGCLTFVHRGESTLGFDGRGVFSVADGHLRLLDRRTAASWVPAVSQDGHYAAWAGSSRGGLRLLVFDLTDGTQVAEQPLPTDAFWVPGIDDLDRVYLMSFAEALHPGRLWTYDIADARLTRVRGVPPLVDAGVTYVTADGVAVRVADFADTGEVTSESIEGTVTPDGRFVSRGTVPIGWSSWSPDRSHVVQETREGFWVQPVDDLQRRVPLRLPVDGRATSSPVWESTDTLLVSFDPGAAPGFAVEAPDQGFDGPTARTWILRCSADSGACEVALGPGNGGDANGSMYR